MEYLEYLPEMVTLTLFGSIFIMTRQPGAIVASAIGMFVSGTQLAPLIHEVLK